MQKTYKTASITEKIEKIDDYVNYFCFLKKDMMSKHIEWHDYFTIDELLSDELVDEVCDRLDKDTWVLYDSFGYNGSYLKPKEYCTKFKVATVLLSQCVLNDTASIKKVLNKMLYLENKYDYYNCAKIEYINHKGNMMKYNKDGIIYFANKDCESIISKLFEKKGIELKDMYMYKAIMDLTCNIVDPIFKIFEHISNNTESNIYIRDTSKYYYENIDVSILIDAIFKTIELTETKETIDKVNDAIKKYKNYFDSLLNYNASNDFEFKDISTRELQMNPLNLNSSEKIVNLSESIKTLRDSKLTVITNKFKYLCDNIISNKRIKDLKFPETKEFKILINVEKLFELKKSRFDCCFIHDTAEDIKSFFEEFLKHISFDTFIERYCEIDNFMSFYRYGDFANSFINYMMNYREADLVNYVKKISNMYDGTYVIIQKILRLYNSINEKTIMEKFVTANKEMSIDDILFRIYMISSFDALSVQEKQRSYLPESISKDSDRSYISLNLLKNIHSISNRIFTYSDLHNIGPILMYILNYKNGFPEKLKENNSICYDNYFIFNINFYINNIFKLLNLSKEQIEEFYKVTKIPRDIIFEESIQKILNTKYLTSDESNNIKNVVIYDDIATLKQCIMETEKLSTNVLINKKYFYLPYGYLKWNSENEKKQLNIFDETLYKSKNMVNAIKKIFVDSLIDVESIEFQETIKNDIIETIDALTEPLEDKDDFCKKIFSACKDTYNKVLNNLLKFNYITEQEFNIVTKNLNSVLLDLTVYFSLV